MGTAIPYELERHPKEITIKILPEDGLARDELHALNKVFGHKAARENIVYGTRTTEYHWDVDNPEWVTAGDSPYVSRMDIVGNTVLLSGVGLPQFPENPHGTGTFSAPFTLIEANLSSHSVKVFFKTTDEHGSPKIGELAFNSVGQCTPLQLHDEPQSITQQTHRVESV